MRIPACAALMLAVAAPAGAQPPSPPTAAARGELMLVVAVFRHGVRAPLSEFAAKANEHAGESWPRTPADWGAKDWGDLTRHGTTLATRLGEYYGAHYTSVWPEGFNATLWADVDQRNKNTANALAAGMRSERRVHVAVDWRPSGPDPLFHPFKAGCGVPQAYELAKIATLLDRGRSTWARERADELRQLDAVLACPESSTSCKPLAQADDVARTWAEGAERSAPVEWKGRFSYASSASEAFLLEYANGMAVAWNRNADIAKLLRLHELYFDKTERDPYLARIGGSTLLREISDQIHRKAGGAQGKCPRGDAAARFVGLVGHDTNLAAMNSLLRVDWRFDDIPDFGMRGFPANDALPAGALVFELYKRAGGHFVRIDYVSQTPAQMRAGAKAVIRIATTCNGIAPCDIPLATFDKAVADAIGADNPFLSACSADGKQQVCP